MELVDLLGTNEEIDVFWIMSSGWLYLDNLLKKIQGNKHRVIAYDPRKETLGKGPLPENIAIICDDAIQTGSRMRQAVDMLMSVGYDPDELYYYVEEFYEPPSGIEGEDLTVKLGIEKFGKIKELASIFPALKDLFVPFVEFY